MKQFYDGTRLASRLHFTCSSLFMLSILKWTNNTKANNRQLKYLCKQHSLEFELSETNQVQQCLSFSLLFWLSPILCVTERNGMETQSISHLAL